MPVETIKTYAIRGVSAFAAALIFIITLPLTLGVALFLLLASMITLVAVRYRLRKAGISQPYVASGSSDQNKSDNSPIEGSYTVIRE